MKTLNSMFQLSLFLAEIRCETQMDTNRGTERIKRISQFQRENEEEMMDLERSISEMKKEKPVDWKGIMQVIILTFAGLTVISLLFCIWDGDHSYVRAFATSALLTLCSVLFRFFYL